MGASGSGKTYSLSTIIESSLDLFIIGTETRFRDSLLDSIAQRKLPRDRVHTRLIQPLPSGFQTLIQSAALINTMSFESLSQIKSGIEKQQYNQYVELLKCLADFRDDEGKAWGPVDSWGNDRALAIDGLSGINLMALDLVVGSKPVRAQGEWGVAMDVEERLINTLTSTVKCLFVLTAHIEKEPNDITGATTIQVGALGKKLAPKLPRFFSEVVLTYRSGNTYQWSTNMEGYDLKKRTLPLSDKIAPTFKPIIDAWRAR